MTSVQIYPRSSDLLEHLAAAVVEIARSAVEQQGLFAVALSGGSTPGSFYRLLAGDPWKARFPWSDAVFFWSDERAVGPADPASNYGMAREAMLAGAKVPHTHVIRMQGEAQDLDRAAREYESEIVAVLGGRNLRFDLILLGMGEDGHTASLFPGTAAEDETEKLVTVCESPRLETRRLTFTFPLINRAGAVFLLVTGEKKAATLKKVFQRAGRFPVLKVRPSDGQLAWWLDRAAAAELGRHEIEEYRRWSSPAVKGGTAPVLKRKDAKKKSGKKG